MIFKSIATTFKFGVVAFLLIVFLFADGLWGSSSGFTGSVLREVTAVLRDPRTQWMVFLCLGIYFTTFLFVRARIATGFWRTASSNLWLGCALIISIMLCLFNHSPSIEALTLFAGAVLGQGVAVWACFAVRSRRSEVRNSLGMVILSLLVMLLALASVWNVNSTHIFEYHGHTRWSGPWDNPNIAGLLMGTGVALALGLGISRRKVEDGKLKAGDMNWKLGVKKYAVVILCFFAAILMARGLLHSYSRGAWLATTCGFTYLAVCELKAQSSGFSGWIRANAFSLTVVAFSIFVLAVWQFGQAREVVARRAFSIGNVNDFSWRTRVAAWEGALQIIAKKPWFGFGWNQPEPMYEHYYRMPKGVEGRAVQLNDYLMLGATLGIPALFCFGMYLWLSLFRNSAFSLQPLELLPATCRAGAIVLLVGFWFDGGLFKLATASTFWILLELGAVQLPQKGTKSANEVP